MFDVPECFRADARWRGDVILRTYHVDEDSGEEEKVDFYCDSSILCLSAPFFETALSGCWKESDPQAAHIDEFGDVLSEVASSIGDPTDTPSRGAIRYVIEMPTEGPHIIKDLLSFLYPHLDLRLHAENWWQLSVLADKIELNRLHKECRKYASSRVYAQPLLTLRWANQFEEPDIFATCSSTILESFEGYRSSTEYSRLPHNVQVLLETTWSKWLQRCMKLIGQYYGRQNAKSNFPAGLESFVRRKIATLAARPTVSIVGSIVAKMDESLCTCQESALGKRKRGVDSWRERLAALSTISVSCTEAEHCFRAKRGYHSP